MKKVFLYNLDRVLLIFLLLIDIRKDEVIFVTYEDKNENLEKLRGEKIFLKLPNLDNYSALVQKIKLSNYIKQIRKENRKILNEIAEGKAELYGIDQDFLGKKLFYKEKINVIEEGTGFYLNDSFFYFGKKTTFNKLKIKVRKIGKKVIELIFNIRERKKVFGYDKTVEKIYLTNNLCKKVPIGLEKKVEIINLKKLWNKKSEEEKKIILDIFNFNDEILKKVDENTIMLFTQPLSEDNMISEEEKIELYFKILRKYNSQSVIIKPHPREKTDYSKYFSNCYVMKEKYPVEILELVGINIKKSVTIFSSAVFGLGKDIEIDFYGTEIHPKLFEIFGTQDKVMKRNAFL